VFRLTIRGTRLRVTVTEGEAAYVVEDGPSLEIEHWGETLTAGPEEQIRPVPPAPELEPPAQPPHREPRDRS
jgi:alpha,alpha-trehalose phosphorylase